MKKIAVILFLFVSLSFLFAELVVDIPFDLDIIGDSFLAGGPYDYTSDWITATNTGAETYTYTCVYSYENMPAGWAMSVCTPTACLIPNFPVSFELSPGESEQFHIIINVTSTGGFNFNMTFDEGDLIEPLSFDFTFNTSDNLGIEDKFQIPVSAIELFQNYPNPFNPTTTISYYLTKEEVENTSIEIYNIKGQLIKTFTNLTASNNFGFVHWDGKDNDGKRVNSGIYFYKLDGVENSPVKKMLLIK